MLSAEEDQKLRHVKSFYNKLNHSQLFGNRSLFNTSEYRLVNISNNKLLSFSEIKIVNFNNGILNFGFDMGTVLYFSNNNTKINNFLSSNFFNFMDQIKQEPSLSHIKVIYYSIHNSLLPFISNILLSAGFNVISKKSEISSNKLSVDGVHSNYKLSLRR